MIKKLKYLGVPRNFPHWMGNCSHTKKIKLELLVLFQDEILSLKNKSCVVEKMPYTNVTALRFAYWHSYSNVIMNE